MLTAQRWYVQSWNGFDHICCNKADGGVFFVAPAERAKLICERHMVELIAQAVWAKPTTENYTMRQACRAGLEASLRSLLQNE